MDQTMQPPGIQCSFKETLVLQHHETIIVQGAYILGTSSATIKDVNTWVILPVPYFVGWLTLGEVVEAFF